MLRDETYAGFLKRQLGLYRPHVTICGGAHVWECLNMLYGWKEGEYRTYRCSTTDEIRYRRSDNLGLVITFWHPAQRKIPQDVLLGILGEVTRANLF